MLNALSDAFSPSAKYELGYKWLSRMELIGSVGENETNEGKRLRTESGRVWDARQRRPYRERAGHKANKGSAGALNPTREGACAPRKGVRALILAGGLDFDVWCATVWALVVETRRRTRRSVKTRIQNPRHRIQPNWTDWELEWWSGVQNGVVESLSDGLATDGTPIKHGYDRAGQMVGKWTGFAHFFPHKSTQVVDFPHLAMVSIFWEEGFHRRGAETQRQAEMGTKVGRLN